MILKSPFLENQSKQHPIRSLCLSTRHLYKPMQYAKENTTDYLVRFRNAQEANEACNGSLITRGVQEHGMQIIFPYHNNRFDSLQEYDKKEPEKAG